MSDSIASIGRRVRLAVARGIVRLVSDDSGLQLIQASLMANEIRSNMERFQEYGFTSNPLPGAQVAVMFVGGNRDHGLIVAVDDKRYRLKGLEGGEVAIYTDEGDKIHLKRGRNIEIETETLTIKAATKVRMETPIVEVTGNIIDEHGTNSNTMAGMRTIFNSHTHNENDSGGPTDPPNQEM